MTGISADHCPGCETESTLADLFFLNGVHEEDPFAPVVSVNDVGICVVLPNECSAGDIHTSQQHVLNQLTAELVDLTRQTAHNLQLNRDARLARLEQRLETGGVQLREVGNPEGMHVASHGHLVNDKFRSNIYTRSFFGGHEEEKHVGHVGTGSCGIQEARVQSEYWARYTKSKLGGWNGPVPMGHLTMKVHYLNPLYVAKRLRRALNFSRSHTLAEIGGRLQCGWERRHGRAYAREEPPSSTPDGPTIFRPTLTLTYNDNYPRPGYVTATTINLTRDKPLFEHSSFGGQRAKSGAYFSYGPSRFKFAPRALPAFNNIAKAAAKK